MSESVGAIHYDVALDLANLIEGQRKVESRLSEMEGEGKRFEGTMRQTARAVASLVAAMGIGAAVQQSVAALRKYEAAVADLSAITGVTGKALSSLSGFASEMAKSTTASALETVEAMKLIASAKPELLDTSGALETVTKEAIALAEASGSSLPEAADTVTTALNQFREGADQAARFVNVLAAGAKFGASEVGDTAVALKNAAVSAGAAGVSFEETNAAIQALAAAGVKGGEAGTALRNVILKLENSTSQELHPSINGLAGALDALNAKQLDSAALTKMFGLENINEAQALLRSTDAVRNLTKELTGTQTAYEQAAIRTQTMDAALTRMGNALTEASKVIGAAFAPAVTKGAELVTAFAVAISEGDTAVRLLGDALAIIGGAVAGNVIRMLASMAAGMTAASVATAAAALAARGFAAALTLMGGPIGIAITGITLLALNWDKVTGAANTAARASEESAQRIAAANKLAGAARGQALGAERTRLANDLADAQRDLADQERRNRDQAARTGADPGAATSMQQLLASMRERVANEKKALSQFDALQIAERGDYSNEGRGSTPTTGAPATTPTATATPTSKPTAAPKFDAEAYLDQVRRMVMDEHELINASHAQQKAENDAHLAAKEVSLAQHAEAKAIIDANAMAQHLDLFQRETDAEVMAQQQRDQALAQAKQQAEAEEDARQAARREASAVIAGDDPVAKLQAEFAAKDALLAEHQAKDLEQRALYEAARVTLKQETEDKIAAIEAQRRSAELQNQAMMYSSISGSFGQIAQATAAFAGKQSGIYKAMFAVSKAFAIADSIVKIQAGLANATAMPFPASLAAYAQVAALGVGIISTITGTSFGGGRQYGGPVDAGRMYRVNETGRPEMFTASNGAQYMMPTANGSVTPADKVGGSQAPAPTIIGGDMRVQINAVPLPGGMLGIAPGDLADALQGAWRDFFIQRPR